MVSLYEGGYDLDDERYAEPIHTIRAWRAPERQEPTINWDHVRSWVNDTPKVPPLCPPPLGFRLVDVVNKKVVAAPSERFEYVCLSYVWGKQVTGDILATSKTIGHLQEDQSLADLRVPATIRDAMTACQHLNQKYLWVDRLCILQDDNSAQGQKQAQIESMGRIYHHAVITLAAIEGQDVGHGLHGVSRRLPLQSRGGERKVYFLKNSKWATRGWTYQEAILSRRLIFFTAQDAVLEDESAKELKTTNSRYQASHFPVFHGPINYKEAVQNYTWRHLSDQKDAVNAFSGACNHLFGNHKFGLPMTGFDDALTWLSEHDQSRRRPFFPSWSWASTEDGIWYPHNYPVISVASWVFVDVDAHGNTSMVYPRPRRHEEESCFPGRRDRYINRMLVATMACQSGCMFIQPPHVQDLPRDFNTFRKNFHDRDGFGGIWTSYEEFWAACRGINLSDPRAQPPYVAEFSGEQRRLAAKPGRVLVSSQTACLGVRKRKKSEKRGADFTIHRDDKWIGLCVFDDLEINADKASQRVCCLGLSAATSHHGRAAGCGLVGNFNKDLERLEEFDDAFEERWSLFHNSMQTKLLADVMNVMIIEERPEGDGIFRRLGFGIIFLEEWYRLERKKCSIVLE